VFEGLFSPTHLLVIALVLFIFIAPRKVANRWHALRESARRLTDGTPDEPGNFEPAGPPPPKRSLAYRVGRRLRRR
jgi:hypothetical protein